MDKIQSGFITTSCITTVKGNFCTVTLWEPGFYVVSIFASLGDGIIYGTQFIPVDELPLYLGIHPLMDVEIGRILGG